MFFLKKQEKEMTSMDFQMLKIICVKFIGG